MNETLIIFFGIALRLAIPLGLACVFFIILHKMDTRWQSDASQEEESQPVEEEKPSDLRTNRVPYKVVR